ncbi:23S rRNA (adenine(1618)-N(6))-methyltransferase RlmF [Colwelliaceae bacterium BS250]
MTGKVLKAQLHPRNRHNNGYDFNSLCKAMPALSAFVHVNKYNNQSIDFANSDAVKCLNSALLKHYYKVNFWDIPKGYLCPPIPGRVDYIHYLADLLKASNLSDGNGSKSIIGSKVSVLDIGTGASCIYAILGQHEYQWRFVASDIDPISINVANTTLKANKGLAKKIECRLQTNAKHILQGIIKPSDKFELTLCNPPFHASLSDASKGSQRKLKNLAQHKSKQQGSAIVNKPNSSIHNDSLNFGGQKAELWCEGGELKFVSDMINESQSFAKQVLWFTCLISKKDNVAPLKLALKQIDATQVKVVDMAQGQKISRFIAWSFHSTEQQQTWFEQ